MSLPEHTAAGRWLGGRVSYVCALGVVIQSFTLRHCLHFLPVTLVRTPLVFRLRPVYPVNPAKRLCALDYNS